jgi:hypothetical protein
MHIHLALYHWKENVSEEKIYQALSQITALEQKIDGIVEITCAKNESQYSEGYTHVILVRARDAKALADYRTHPDHQSAAAMIESMEEKGIGVDFSTDRTNWKN